MMAYTLLHLEASYCLTELVTGVTHSLIEVKHDTFCCFLDL